MRGPQSVWAQIGDLRVVDGDDVEWRGARYRIKGYDAPEPHNFRSKRDRDLEWTRGVKAMYRLATLIRGARSVALIPTGEVYQRGKRTKDVVWLIIDGRDAGHIAMSEGWACHIDNRQVTDWGRWETPFPDDLPMPEGMEEYPGDDDD